MSPDRFNFFQSLPLVLLAVVGGIGSAAGALVAGILLGGLPLMTEQFAWMANLEKILPGTMGIALGRNPNGVAHDLRLGFAPLLRSRIGTAVTVVATAGVLGARLAEAISGWGFALALVAAVLVPGLLLRLVDARRSRAAVAPTDTGDVADVAWEWVGIDRPYTPDDAAALDRALGLEATVR